MRKILILFIEFYVNFMLLSLQHRMNTGSVSVHQGTFQTKKPPHSRRFFFMINGLGKLFSFFHFLFQFCKGIDVAKGSFLGFRRR